MEPAFIVAALIGGLTARFVRLPPLAGFLAAGFALNALGYETTEALETVADLGVTLLLFTIGLKLSVRTLLRPDVWAATTIHLLASTLLFVGVLSLLKLAGMALVAGTTAGNLLVVAFALSFSSTVFAVKVLDDRGEARSLYGRIAIGVLVMQDVFAVIYLTTSTGELPSPYALLLLLLIPATPLLRRLLAAVGHGELQVLTGVCLALVLGHALFESVGLKGELGALIVGMLLAPHPAATSLSASLFNLKELFLVGFFLSIGLTALPSVSTFALAVVTVLLVPVKAAMFLAVFSAFRLRRRTATLATLSLATFSEFGLIVAVLANEQGLLDDQWLVVLSLAVAISFVVDAVLNSAGEGVYQRVEHLLPRQDPAKMHSEDRPIEIGDARAVVLGMGRVGEGAYRRLTDYYGLPVLGIENDPDKAAALRADGLRVVDGDADDSDFWNKLVLSPEVCLVLLAMPHHAGNTNALRELRDRDFPGRISAIVQHRDQIQPMRDAGADAVFHLYETAGPALADQAARVSGLEDPDHPR